MYLRMCACMYGMYVCVYAYRYVYRYEYTYACMHVCIVAFSSTVWQTHMCGHVMLYFYSIISVIVGPASFPISIPFVFLIELKVLSTEQYP